MTVPVTPPLRVLEIAQGIAGPLCGRLFAGFGHDVLKCEPPGGDRQRAAGPAAADGTAFSFTALNEAKRGLSADLADPASRARVEELAGVADVVICDLPPARAREFGWDDETITARWPSLVWTWVSGFGRQDAGLAGLPDDSLLAESYAGLAYVIGDPDRAPLALGGEQAGYAAGFAAFLAARLALRRRDRGGGGEIIDVAAADVAAYLDWKSDVSACEVGDVPVRNATTSWWRVLPAADGFAGLIYHDRDWPKLVTLIGDERLTDPRFAQARERIAGMGEWLPAVAAWIAARPAQAVYEQAQRAGLPFGYAADMADLATDPQYRARGFVRAGSTGPRIGPPWRMAGSAWRESPLTEAGHPARWLEGAGPRTRPAATNGTASGTAGSTERKAPLDGVTVLDLGTITAGAAVGRLLTDYGATVIKVENPQHPDPFRRWASASGDVTGESPLFEANNAGKLGVALDLKHPEGRDALLRLAETADVLIENYRVGVTERLGISFSDLSAVNPRLIYLSLASQGQDGPQARYSSYGSTLDLISGLGSVTGYPDGPPVWSSYLVNYPDQLASLAGAALVVQCVADRTDGTHIDLSQRELVSWTLADFLADQLVTGQTAGRTGNRRPHAVPHDAYRCQGADRWVAVACFDGPQRAALADVLGAAPDWADPEAVDAAVGAWTAARTREECVAALRTAGVAAVPVLDAWDRATEEHFSRRRVFIDGPTGRRTRGFPFVLRNYVPPVPARAPAVGEHNERFAAQPRPR
jgi:crotonobetainyl-CoA:carnitine CoA-transferase CaiB-like acyl-CoA transferase